MWIYQATINVSEGTFSKRCIFSNVTIFKNIQQAYRYFSKNKCSELFKDFHVLLYLHIYQIFESYIFVTNLFHRRAKRGAQMKSTHCWKKNGGTQWDRSNQQPLDQCPYTFPTELCRLMRGRRFNLYFISCLCLAITWLRHLIILLLLKQKTSA